MTNSPPLIIVLDIDGTIIGNISPQASLFDLQQQIKSDKQGFSKINLIDVKGLRHKLNNGIIRPHLKHFINNTKAEFFIYTASSNDWANFLVPHIENVLGIKFNRPLMTRNHCELEPNVKQKSKSKIDKIVFNSLKKKYKDSHPTFEQVQNNMLIIDNNPDVYSAKDLESTIVCSSYTFLYPENVPAKLNEETFNNYKHLIETKAENHRDFEYEFYKIYVDTIKYLDKYNNKSKADKFFYLLTNILNTRFKNNQSLSHRDIRYISKYISNNE
jgi:hypothetical protein